MMDNNLQNNIQSQDTNTLNQNNQIIENNIDKKKSLPVRNIIFLILTAANVSTIVPFVFNFGVIWLIFGGLNGDKVNHRNILFACIAYIIGSILALLISIWNVVKYNKIAKTIYLIILSLLVIAGIMYYLVKKFF